MGGVQLWEISRDGNVREQPLLLTSVFLPPGSRSTVVVVAPLQIGNYAVRTLAVDTGPQGDPNPDVRLATLAVVRAGARTRPRCRRGCCCPPTGRPRSA